MAIYNAPNVEEQSINCIYTGTVDSISIIESGLYYFNFYGGGGGNGQDYDKKIPGYGGISGRTQIYEFLKKGDMIYACIGSAGGSYAKSGGGGFNGGGHGGGNGTYRFLCGGGGGATHIAREYGLLKNISKESIIGVAGGGGGSGAPNESNPVPHGGYGGGINGNKGGDDGQGVGGNGGTQTSAGKGGGFGYGSNAYTYGGGGGGGLYGGGQGGQRGGGGGGSGYLYSDITIYRGLEYHNYTRVGGGTRANNGALSITFIKKKSPTFYFGDLPIKDIYFGDKKISSCYFGDSKVL